MTTSNQLEQLIAELSSLQCAVISTMATVPAVLTPSSPSAYLAKVTTPESPAQIGGLSMNGPFPFPLRLLVLKPSQSEQTPQPNNSHPVAIQQLHN